MRHTEQMIMPARIKGRLTLKMELIVTNPDGSTEGVHPNDIPREQIIAEFPARSVTEAIRAKCLDCSVYQVGEIRKCTAVGCPLWPFRMGKNRFSNRRGNVSNLRRGCANDNQVADVSGDAA